MKRLLLILFCCCSAAAPAYSQQPPAQSAPVAAAEQWRQLLVAVSNEEWDAAFGLSTRLLREMKQDDEAKRLPRLRYIHMYAAAGRVTEGRMSFEQLEQALKDFKGKEVEMPYREITRDCGGALNFICPADGAKDRLFVSASNKSGTSILAFEYIGLKEAFDAAKHEGEQASVGGIIQRIVPNPNKSRAIVMRIYVAEGYVKLDRPEPQKASNR
ncbi:MAG TPA: hypothetical protein VEY11_05530 [Pyrinomonadaceae bacterium]|nr:hypothetical protein [Pyrinomonadaceae bacterium]